jgi:hypothetical protein
MHGVCIAADAFPEMHSDSVRTVPDLVAHYEVEYTTLGCTLSYLKNVCIWSGLTLINLTGDLPACFLHKELDNLALSRLVDAPSMFVHTYFRPAFQHLH